MSNKVNNAWWHLRDALNNTPPNPLYWSGLILEMIENKSRIPAKYKWPMIFSIIDNFRKLPVAEVDLSYLSFIFNDASVRQHQGYGERVKFMRVAFGKLSSIAEEKIRQKLELSCQTSLPLLSS